MPATRSQKAALASPLASTTRKRSVSRAPSSEPAPRATTTTTTNTTTKRKAEEVGRGAAEGPKKRARTFREKVFQEDLQKRVREAREQQSSEPEAAPVGLRPGAYPSPSRQPAAPGFASAAAAAAPQDGQREYAWYKAPETPAPATAAPPQQVAQTQPQPARGFLGRLLDTITPFKRRSQTPSRDTRLPDARYELFQLTNHVRLQQDLNSGLDKYVAMEEQRQQQQQQNSATPHHEYEAEQEQAQPGSKRKRSANDITGLPPLNVISESPEATFTDNMQTPSRVNAKTHNGLVPKSQPRPRRTYKDARAAKGNRSAADPPTPAISRTAPTTPYDKNNYEHIRRAREMVQLQAQQKAMQAKLDKLRAEQEAEAEAQPRKTKRVKVDHLRYVPHNIPGESSGSFRVPEVDSDDEMEVDEDAELIDNPFEAPSPLKTAPTPTPLTKAPSPLKTASSSSAQAPSPLKTAPSLTQAPSPLKTATSSLTNAPSPSKTAPSSFAQAPSPLKTATPSLTKAPSPLKTAPTFTKQVTEVVEVEDDDRHGSATTSPEPAQVFSDAESESDYNTDAEDWPELPPRKANKPESPKNPWNEKFMRDFNHWQTTGEVLRN